MLLPTPSPIVTDAPKITDWMQAWATIGGAALTVVAVGLTGALLVHEVRAARKSREMAEEEIRPYVIVDFDFRSILALLVIQNIGRSIAYDVEIKFKPPLASKAFNFDDVEALKQPVSMIAPGRNIPLFFDDIVERGQGLPMTYRVSIRYRDSAQRWYEDPAYVLDLQMFMGSAMPPGGLPELVNYVKDIRDEMQKWRHAGSAIHVRTINHRAELKRSRKALLKRRAEQEATKAKQEAEVRAQQSEQPE